MLYAIHTDRVRIGDVEAESYPAAARLALPLVYRHHGLKRPSGAWAERVSGDADKSGVFRPFRKLGVSSSTSCGPDFHVM